jgi:hypothetical protein
LQSPWKYVYDWELRRKEHWGRSPQAPLFAPVNQGWSASCFRSGQLSVDCTFPCHSQRNQSSSQTTRVNLQCGSVNTGLISSSPLISPLSSPCCCCFLLTVQSRKYVSLIRT